MPIRTPGPAQIQRPAILHTPTLWVTVQGRVVYMEGCAADPSLAQELESVARTVPQVQQAIALLKLRTSKRPHTGCALPHKYCFFPRLLAPWFRIPASQERASHAEAAEGAGRLIAAV